MLYRPHKKQAEAHKAFLADKKKRGILLWGRQVGKTVWAINHAWMSAAMQQGRYLIVFPTYKQAKDTIWNQYLHYIPKELIADANNTDLTIKLKYIDNPIKLEMPDGSIVEFPPHNPDLPPSSIELKGSDDADRLRGMKANGLIFDEYAIQIPEHWPTVFQPMLSTTNGWASFISTPKGFNHFYEMVLHAENESNDWWISRATWRDNPAITPEFISAVKSEADEKGELSSFMQEYELEFRSVEGAVYPEFDRHIHKVSPKDLPKTGTIVAGIDFGWTEDHPTAVVFVLIDNDQNWWVFDELRVSKMQIDDIIQMIRTKLAGKHLTTIVGDSARPEYIEQMSIKGLPIVPVSKVKDSILMGIRLVGQMLKPRIQLIGDPKPKMYVTENCINTIYEFEMYKYPTRKKDRAVSELPMKIDDHFMDAIRYVTLYLKYGIVNKDKPLTSSISKQFNEYNLL